MKDNYIVYMHISPNNKRYIGITSQKNVKRRWNNGHGYRNNAYFWRAINKYGWDNFEHIIIAKELTKEEAEWLEIELIKIWDSINPNKGYNISLGGSSNGKHSEETKKKIGESSKGRCVGEKGYWYGKHLPQETKEKISKSRKGQNLSQETKEKISIALSGENHWNYGKRGEGTPMFGKKHSDVTKEKMSKVSKGVPKSKQHKENLSKNHANFNGKNNPQAILYNIYDEHGKFIDCKCGREIYDKLLNISFQSFQKIINNNGIVDIDLFKRKEIKEKLIHFIGWKFLINS